MRNFKCCVQEAAIGRLFAFHLLFFALAACLPGGAHAFTALVRFVPDGDTVVIGDGRVVRLAGIDAPEMGRDGVPAQYYGEEAGERLRSLLLGRAVEISPMGGDRHGRMVAELSLDDGSSVQELLVAQGCAFVYPHPDVPDARVKRLLRLQREAIASGRGFWPNVLLSRQNENKWAGNTNSLRFGPEKGCRPLEQTFSGRRVAFRNLREAFWEGFAPYRECRSPFNLQN